MPTRSNRLFPIALVVSAVVYIVAGAIVSAIATTAIDRGTANLMRGLHQIFFSEIDSLVLLSYWMGMRLGARQWSTWFVPLLLGLLSALLTYFVAPYSVSMFVSRPSIGQIDLSMNTLNYLIWYEGAPCAFALWFAACLVWLLSRAVGVYLVPCNMDRSEINLEADRTTNWRMFGLSTAIIIVIHSCLFLMSVIDFSRLLIATTAILIWFGFAAIVSNGFKNFSWFGMLSMVVAMFLPLSFWPWLSLGRTPLSMIALVCVVTLLWSLFKWLLFAWALHVCGYRHVAYQHFKPAIEIYNEEWRHRPAAGTESELPIREWII